MYVNVVDFQDVELNFEQAEKALELFGEYVEEARQGRGRHPNMDRLRSAKSL